jgi:hypothetical protein
LQIFEKNAKQKSQGLETPKESITFFFLLFLATTKMVWKIRKLE